MGSVTLQNDGTFRMRQWIYMNGRTQSVTATGTYSVGQDCTLSLTFAPGAAVSGGGTTGAVAFQAPTTFRGTLNTSIATTRGAEGARGALVIQPVGVTTIVGRFVGQ